jgi:hypothetical protein
MTALTKLLERLEKLEKAATAKPWENEDHRGRSSDWRSTGLIWSRNKGDGHPGTPVCQVECDKLYAHAPTEEVETFQSNAELITTTRNSLGTLIEIIKLQAEALEYYANHESVIKEAYHSNEERQITCVHTFINHKAKEAQAKVEEIAGRLG